MSLTSFIYDYYFSIVLQEKKIQNEKTNHLNFFCFAKYETKFLYFLEIFKNNFKQIFKKKKLNSI